ncbi:MAG: hypothetical protein ACYSX0_22715, partial [Planctomycetota bacterium]
MKESSRLHRFLGWLPFTPSSYMSRYFTTIGDTIAVPTRYSEQHIAADPQAFVVKHFTLMEHEGIHILRRERVGSPWYELAYLGPSAC